MRKKIVLLIIFVMFFVSFIGFSNDTVQAYLRGNFSVKLDGKVLDLRDANGNEVVPIVVNGSTYLPVRAISQNLGLDVDWDDATKTVILENSNFNEIQTKAEEGKKVKFKNEEPENEEPKNEEPKKTDSNKNQNSPSNVSKDVYFIKAERHATNGYKLWFDTDSAGSNVGKLDNPLKFVHDKSKPEQFCLKIIDVEGDLKGKDLKWFQDNLIYSTQGACITFTFMDSSKAFNIEGISFDLEYIVTERYNKSVHGQGSIENLKIAY